MTRAPLHCPTCKKDVAAEAKTYPFCCERCRTIDLGNWLTGRYAVPASNDDAGHRDPDRDPEDQG